MIFHLEISVRCVLLLLVSIFTDNSDKHEGIFSQTESPSQSRKQYLDVYTKATKTNCREQNRLKCMLASQKPLRNSTF